MTVNNYRQYRAGSAEGPVRSSGRKGAAEPGMECGHRRALGTIPRVEKAPRDLGGNNRVRTTGQTGCVETGTSEGAHASLNETSVCWHIRAECLPPRHPGLAGFGAQCSIPVRSWRQEASEEAIWPGKGRVPMWASFCEGRGWNHSLAWQPGPAAHRTCQSQS